MDINKKIRIFKKPAVYITWKHIYIAVTAVLSAILLVLLGMTVMRFVRVGDVSVVGLSPYDKMELLEALAIEDDTFWAALDERELEEKLVAERQLLTKVKVRKQFPNRLEIEVVESRSVRWYIDIAGRKYTLDSDLYVIEETKNTEGATKLVLPNVSKILERKVPEFGQSDAERIRTLKIIEAVRSSEIRSRVTELDVEKPYNITMVIDGKYTAELGDPENIEGKLNMIALALKQDKVKNSKGGILHAETYTEGGYASFQETVQ